MGSAPKPRHSLRFLAQQQPHAYTRQGGHLSVHAHLNRDIDTALSVEGMRPHRTDDYACVVKILVLTNNDGAADLYASTLVLEVKQTRRLPLG